MNIKDILEIEAEDIHSLVNGGGGSRDEEGVKNDVKF